MKKKGYEKNTKGGGEGAGGGIMTMRKRYRERDAEAESMTKVQLFFQGLLLSMYMIYM